MKSYIKTLMFASVLAGASACTNLDTDINSQYTKYPNHEVAVQAKLDRKSVV